MKKQPSLNHKGTQKRLLVILLMGSTLFLSLNVFLRSDPKASEGKASRPRQSNSKIQKRSASSQGLKPLIAYSALLRTNPFAPVIKTNGRRGSYHQNGSAESNPALAPLPPLGVDLKVVPQDAKNPDKSQSSPYRYTGYVIVEGIPYALIEETKEGQSGYYRPGDLFGNFRISKISPEKIVLASDKGTVELPRSVAPPPTPNRGRNNRQGIPPTPSAPVASTGGTNPAEGQFQSTEVETPNLQGNPPEEGNQGRGRGPGRRRFRFFPNRDIEGNAL